MKSMLTRRLMIGGPRIAPSRPGDEFTSAMANEVKRRHSHGVLGDGQVPERTGPLMTRSVEGTPVAPTLEPTSPVLGVGAAPTVSSACPNSTPSGTCAERRPCPKHRTRPRPRKSISVPSGKGDSTYDLRQGARAGIDEAYLAEESFRNQAATSRTNASATSGCRAGGRRHACFATNSSVRVSGAGRMLPRGSDRADWCEGAVAGRMRALAIAFVDDLEDAASAFASGSVAAPSPAGERLAANALVASSQLGRSLLRVEAMVVIVVTGLSGVEPSNDPRHDCFANRLTAARVIALAKR